MCYRKHSAVLEFLSYCILNQGICFHINTCCSFINTEYLKNKIFVFYFITLKICHLIISQWTKLHFILCFREMILLGEKSSFICTSNLVQLLYARFLQKTAQCTFVFVNMALAKHISCFCPTENILPLSPTSASSPPSFSTADTR